MIATLSFFHFSIQRKIKALSLSPEIEKIMFEVLLPVFYLRNAATKAKKADARCRLKMKSDEILSSCRCLKDTVQEELAALEPIAKECANLFQRSSSCVEGRNGQLSLRHHSFHSLSNRKLSALTAVHNFFIRRMDGTTAAERFFGNKPKEMFEFLLKTVNLPGRPAQKRRRPSESEPLLSAA